MIAKSFFESLTNKYIVVSKSIGIDGAVKHKKTPDNNLRRFSDAFGNILYVNSSISSKGAKYNSLSGCTGLL